MLPEIPYSKLKTFYYVAVNSSFKKAADKLYITEGAISQQVKNLEQLLGKKLFERSSRKVALTTNGESLFNLVAPVVEKFETIGLEFEQITGKLRGKIKVASFEAMLLRVFPNYIEKFRSKYPECEIILFNVFGKQIRSMILSGEVDFAIGTVEGLPDQIVGEELWRFERYFIAPLDHYLSRVKRLTLEDIAKYPIVMPDKEGTAGSLLDKLLRSCNPDLKVTVESLTWEVVMKYVELGFGVSLVPGIVIQAKDRKRLYIKNMSNLDERIGLSRYGVLVKKGKYLSPATKELIRLLSPSFDFDPFK
jgi:DNA-binding transcriptional LysR family regulator